MLRLLALLTVCFAAVLLNGGLAAAHERQLIPPQVFEIQAGPLVVSGLEADQDGCAPGQSCCTAACAPCQLPLPADQGNASPIILASLIADLPPEQAPSSNIPGRDPPIPRTVLV